MGESLSTDDLTSWRADWQGRRIAVLGLGERGFSVADTLCELGAEVLVVAEEAGEEHRELLDVIGADLEVVDDARFTGLLLAPFDPEVCVVASGSPMDWEIFPTPFWTDTELAWRVRDKRPDRPPMEWITVTGDGSEVIAGLTARILLASGVRAAPAGGDGVPAIDAVREPEGFDVLVVRLGPEDLGLGSSAAPLAAGCVRAELVDDVVLQSGTAYHGARIACVYGVGDESRALVEDADVQEGCRAIGVSLGVPGPSELGLVDDLLVDRAFLEERRTSALELATLDDVRAAGLGDPDGVLRVLTAAALARAAGAPPAAVREAIRWSAAGRDPA